jgi:hypothetical protein
MSFYKIIESNTNFFNKGYGRIFVHKKEDVKKVEKFLKEFDKYEWNNYYLKGEEFVAVWDPKGKNKLIYHSKFDVNIPKFTEYCKERGIEILIRTDMNSERLLDFYL